VEIEKGMLIQAKKVYVTRGSSRSELQKFLRRPRWWWHIEEGRRRTETSSM